jgi:hypothetical protein
MQLLYQLATCTAASTFESLRQASGKIRELARPMHSSYHRGAASGSGFVWVKNTGRDTIAADWCIRRCPTARIQRTQGEALPHTL